jgi:methyl coenzyme M reductase subunit D
MQNQEGLLPENDDITIIDLEKIRRVGIDIELMLLRIRSGPADGHFVEHFLRKL